jgi:hypothetical protein
MSRLLAHLWNANASYAGYPGRKDSSEVIWVVSGLTIEHLDLKFTDIGSLLGSFFQVESYPLSRCPWI